MDNIPVVRHVVTRARRAIVTIHAARSVSTKNAMGDTIWACAGPMVVAVDRCKYLRVLYMVPSILTILSVRF